jgi:hypothetical protein
MYENIKTKNKISKTKNQTKKDEYYSKYNEI